MRWRYGVKEQHLRQRNGPNGQSIQSTRSNSEPVEAVAANAALTLIAVASSRTVPACREAAFERKKSGFTDGCTADDGKNEHEKMERRSKAWFPAKRHGIGWGFPSCWQGRVVMAAWMVLVVGGIRCFGLISTQCAT